VPIAKITREGLTAIAFAVVLLWSCVFGERALARQAYAERARVLREVTRTQQAPRPIRVSFPMLPAGLKSHTG